MISKLTTWSQKHSELLKFCFKTVSYALIIFVLVYLYDYRGVNDVHFIYNEF